MSKIGVPIPPLPQALSGNLADDIDTIYKFLANFRQQLIVASGIVQRLDAIGKLNVMTTEISATPTKAEIDEIRTLLNNVIRAAKGEQNE
jgi:hypothetical protein